jgi:hypothetical protein
MHKEYHKSNFYSTIDSCYIELGGFGMASMFVGALDPASGAAFHFEALTAGEYALSYGKTGVTETYYRTLYLSQRQIVAKFPQGVPKEMVGRVKAKQSGIDKVDQVVLEVVLKEKRRQFSYTRYFFLLSDESRSDTGRHDQPLEVDHFYEHPYATARWSEICRTAYALGPGVRAVPDIKRLQEMEKSILMATHKMVDPPVNAPGRMKGKLSTLPGAKNWYANPSEQVVPIYQMQFDIGKAEAVLARVEQRIQKCFYNDVFLTGSRDPNASPYKATEVTAREQERMLRLGPIVERLQHEFLRPIIERCFNIMLRAGKFPPLSPELQEMVGDYEITLVSPLATAQRMVALQGINSFLAFLGQAAQFDQEIMDNVDTDAAARDYADITGVRMGILRPEDDVKAIREKRAQAMAQERAKQEAAQQAALNSQLSTEQATAQKTQAEAGSALIDGQAKAIDSGLM